MIHDPVNRIVMYLSSVLTFPLSVCVLEHQIFETVPYGKRLKINLILNSSLVHLYYTRENDPTEHLLMDKGQLTSVTKAFMSSTTVCDFLCFTSVIETIMFKIYYIRCAVIFLLLQQRWVIFSFCTICLWYLLLVVIISDSHIQNILYDQCFGYAVAG